MRGKETKLLLTKELGRLAKWLRILGIDAAYSKEGKTGSLIIDALREERIIVTRNHRLKKAAGIKLVMIKAENIKRQISEVLRELKIKPTADLMFSRCVICNRELIGIEKEKVKDRVPEYVFKNQDNFTSCPECKRLYWRGTHWGDVEKTLKEIMG